MGTQSATSQPGEAAEARSGLSIGDLARMLLRRWFLILASTLLCTAAAYLYLRTQSPVYEASAVLRIDGSRANSLGLGELGTSGVIGVDLQTEMAILQSEGIGIQTLNSLSDADFRSYTGRDKASFAFPTDGARMTVDQQRTLNLFEYEVRTKPLGDTQLLRVGFRYKDPQLAATIANQLTATYLQQSVNSRYESVSRASSWLSNQLTSLRARANDAQRKLGDFQEAQGILGTATANTTTDTMKLLNDRLTTAQADRMLKEAQVRAAENGDPAALAAIFPNPKLQSLQTEQGTLYARYADLSSKFGAGYTPLAQLKQQMDALDAEIKRNVQTVRNQLREEYKVAKDNEDMLRQQYDAEVGKAFGESRQQTQLSLLQADETASRELYDTLELKLQQAGINAGLAGVNTMLVDAARAPLDPVEPRKLVVLSFGAAIGFVVSICAVFLIVIFESAVQNVRQFSQDFEGSVLVTSAPQEGRKLSQGVLSIVENPSSDFAEAMRRLRNLLGQTNGPSNLKLLLVTSPHEHEGKTVVAGNYSVAVAQTGAKVLLVDAELRRPTLHEQFGLENSRGLSDLLAIDAATPAFAQPITALPNLSFLAAGPGAERASELLASGRLYKLLEEWTKQFDFVIVKTAPVLDVSDSLPLARWADGILLIVRKGMTRVQAIRDAQQTLLSVDGKLVAALLNFAAPSDSTAGKTYGRTDANR